MYSRSISIHVPARGTTYRIAVPTETGVFQSTYPHGVRPEKRHPHDPGRDISIHVPARGTTKGNGLLAVEGYFNPRTRTGYDRRWQFPLVTIWNFNPRTARGTTFVPRVPACGY